MTDEERPVQRGLDLRERLDVARLVGPVERHRLVDGVARHLLDRHQRFDHVLALLGCHRGRERVAAVRDHDGRYAVARARREERIPELAGVEMRVRVDPSRREHQPAPVELLGAGAGHLADDHDPVAVDRDVGLEAGRAGAVDTVAPRTTRSCALIELGSSSRGIMLALCRREELPDHDAGLDRLRGEPEHRDGIEPGHVWPPPSMM